MSRRHCQDYTKAWRRVTQQQERRACRHHALDYVISSCLMLIGLMTVMAAVCWLAVHIGWWIIR